MQATTTQQRNIKVSNNYFIYNLSHIITNALAKSIKLLVITHGTSYNNTNIYFGIIIFLHQIQEC